MSLFVPEKQTLQDGVHKSLRINRHRDGDSEGIPDVLLLGSENIQDNAIDTVVGPVVGENADGLFLLAEAVDPSLALLVAGGVPCEVVVDDRIEGVLEVDTLGEAVGCDEKGLLCFGELLDAYLSLLGR